MPDDYLPCESTGYNCLAHRAERASARTTTPMAITPPSPDAAIAAVADLDGPIVGNGWQEDARQLLAAALPLLGESEWGRRFDNVLDFATTDRVTAKFVADVGGGTLVHRIVTPWTEAP